jgi:hypothetical protein
VRYGLTSTRIARGPLLFLRSHLLAGPASQAAITLLSHGHYIRDATHEYIFAERDGRKGPPAGNKTRLLWLTDR